MRVVGVQMDIAWEDRRANHPKVRQLLQGAEVRSGDLVVLPEMFASGFTMNVNAAADDANETGAFLSQVARERGVFVLAGVVGRGQMCRNEAVVIDPRGNEVARYCKMHPFTPGGEHEHYARGEKIVTFEWAGMRVCPVICYDLRFPEIFRRAILDAEGGGAEETTVAETRGGVGVGAEMFVVIANWPSVRAEHWTTLLAARAIENQAYVVGVNRVGRDPLHEYSGRSMIVDPQGNVIAVGGEKEGLVQAEIDGEAVRRWRGEFPILKDARFVR